MASLQDTEGETAGETVRFQSPELGENGGKVSISDTTNENMTGKDAVMVVTRRVVETTTLVETFRDGSAPITQGKEKGGNSSALAKNESSLHVDGSGPLSTGKEDTFADNSGFLRLGGINGVVSDNKSGVQEVAERNRKEDLEGNKGQNVDENNLKEDDVKECDAERVFSVGDFVFGKIKSHPWWPGQIYDSADASDYARNFGQTGRYLVAYFGDGSFSWCTPSQLIPFEKNFEQMAKQSNAKGFVKALGDAMDEIQRLREVQMTCRCVPEKYKFAIHGSLARNAGIRDGALVPQGEISGLPLTDYEPAQALAKIKQLAQDRSVDSVLGLTSLRSWLSAFYRARGGYSMPMFQEPQLIEGLDDKLRNAARSNDFSKPIEVPLQGQLEEDGGSPSVPGSRKSPMTADGKPHHKRKQKSVAELMRKDTDKPKNKKSGITDGMKSSKPTSGMGIGKVNEDAGNCNGVVKSVSGRKRGRKKKADLSMTLQTGENEAANADKGVAPGAEKLNTRPLPLDLEKMDVSDVEMNDKEERDQISSPRERKKSKYLSPPYTTPSWRAGSSSSKRVPSEGVSGLAQIGDQKIEAAAQGIVSTPTLEPCGKAVKEKSQSTILGSPGFHIPQTGGQEPKKALDSIDVNIPVATFLADVRSTALDPQLLGNEGAHDRLKGFLLAYRSSVCQAPNIEDYQKGRPGRKRKSFGPVPITHGADVSQGDSRCPEARDETLHQTNSGITNLKKAARASGMKNTPQQKVGEFTAATQTVDISSVVQKVDMLKSMLEKSNGRISTAAKTKLEVEMDRLLEEVRTVTSCT